MLLIENQGDRTDLLTEHGLSFWIQTDTSNILFDTGQGPACVENAKQLGVPLEKTDSVVFSHGHYDHTGGLASVLTLAGKINVYAHPAAFEPKFKRNDDGSVKPLGVSLELRDTILSGIHEFVWTQEVTEIDKRVFATGEIPRRTTFEQSADVFCSDELCLQVDPFLDDQALYIETAKGLVVLLGCAHAGVVNTLKHIRELTSGQHIHALMGGMHLHNADDDKLKKTMEYLKTVDIDLLVPLHCTGERATEMIKKEFPEKYHRMVVGDSLTFPDS